MINQQLWPYLIGRSPFQQSTRALAFFYKTMKHKEHYLYLYHAMAFIVYEDQIQKLDQQSANDSTDIDMDKLYQDHLNEQNAIEFDSFVFDLHTGAATSKSNFALEGALVVNECKELFNEKYRQMYNEFKVMIDNQEQTKTTKRKQKTMENSTVKKTKTVEQIIDDDLDKEIVRLGYQLEIQSERFVTENLSELVRGQRRTGAHKKSVFISSDYVYKGPYLSDQPGDRKKFLNNLYFTRALLTLEDHLQIPENYRSIFDWTSIIKIDQTNQYYLKQKFLGTVDDSKDNYEVANTKIETNVKVFRRGSHIHRLIELEKDQQDFANHHSQICQAAVQHLYLRYLLNIGDSGTWNILVRRDRTDLICGIDFEELRPDKVHQTKDPFVLIMSKVSKQQRQIYHSFTKKILRFENPIDVNGQLATTLAESFKIPIENVNKRIQLYENCFL